MLNIDPLIAVGVVAATAVTDAAYVFFNAAVTARRRIPAANWSACWYLLSAFAVISYTENAVYVAFAALGSWLGAYASVTWLVRPASPPQWRAGDGHSAALRAALADRVEQLEAKPAVRQPPGGGAMGCRSTSRA
jgi:hypothetical protein